MTFWSLAWVAALWIISLLTSIQDNGQVWVTDYLLPSSLSISKKLRVISSKCFSAQVLASKFSLHNVLQPQLGPSATITIISNSLSWPCCPTDGENCQNISPEGWDLKSGATQPSHGTFVASDEVIPLGTPSSNNPDYKS